MDINRRKFVTLSSLGILGAFIGGCVNSDKILLKKNYTIACLGDTITAEKDGYVQLLQNYVDENHSNLNISFLNWGKNSETITGLSEQGHSKQRPYLFERLDKLLSSTHVDLFLFCYGMNCGMYGPPSAELFDSYTIGIYSFLEKIKLKGTKAILLTPPPLALEAVPLTTNSSDKAYDYSNPYPKYQDEVLLKFCAIIHTVTHANVLGIIDIHGPLLKHQEKCYDDDPILPNKAGHQLIMNTVIDHFTI